MPDPEDAERLEPGPRLAVQQLKALLWQKWLVKKRAPLTSILELISPVLLISLLVLAFALVDPEDRPERIYVNDTTDLLRNISRDIGHELAPSFSLDGCADLLSSFNSSSPAPTRQQGWDPAAAGPQAAVPDPELLQACLGAARQNASGFLGPGLAGNSSGNSSLPWSGIVLDLLQGFIRANGPLPIPTFDEFVGLHLALQAAVEADPSILALLHGARRSFGWNVLGNLIDMGVLAFAPATPEVLRLADHMSKTHEFFSDVFHGVFPSEAEGTDFALNGGQRMWALVVFTKGPSPDGCDYTIRTNFTSVPRTFYPVNPFARGIPIHYKEYYTSGFLSLQSAIEGYVLGLDSSSESSLGPFPAGQANATWWTMWGSVMPTASWVHNEFYDAVGPLMGLLISMSVLFPLAMLVRGIVEERERRQRETMCIMGLQPGLLTAAWALVYGAVFLTTAVSVTLFCWFSFLPATNPACVLLLLLLFSAAELTFGMMVAAVFSNSKIAAICGPLLHFGFLLPRYIFFRTGAPQAVWAKLLVCLLSPTAFTFAADLLGDYEGSGRGLGWRDLWTDPLPFGAICLMLTLDTFLYGFLAWYLEKVSPHLYGQQLPCWFVFSPSYWRRGHLPPPQRLRSKRSASLLESLPSFTRASRQHDYELARSSDHSPNEMSEDEEASHTAERAPLQAGGRAPPSSNRVAVDMQNLRKVYDGHVAVEGMSLQMKLGETLALLGHNGAGKTTLVGMLTGLLRPTSGDAVVCRHSVVRQPALVRQHLGVCPQTNILWDQLTVWEHFLLYAAIKGIPGGAWGARAKSSAEEMVQAVCLQNKKDCRAGALSGGMKRKLQVGLALLGKSSVVLLDEPTSGVDPVSRRSLWDILEKQRSGRALLLTTHFMDEADLLADRIAIMADGRLVALGTPLALKQKYSQGYSLVLTLDLERDRDLNAIAACIAKRVTGAHVLRATGAELVFQLPMSEAKHFADLLDDLAAEGDNLGILHYGICMPTLEDVFLQCTADSKHVMELAGAGLPGDHVVELEMAPPSRTPTSGSSRNSSPSVGPVSPRSTTQSPPPPSTECSHQPRSPSPSHRTSEAVRAAKPQRQQEVPGSERGSPPAPSQAAAEISAGPPHAEQRNEAAESRSEELDRGDADGVGLGDASLPERGARGADPVASGEALDGRGPASSELSDASEASQRLSGQGGEAQGEGPRSWADMHGRGGLEGRPTGKSLASSSSESMEGYRGGEPEQERGWRRGRGPRRKRGWALQWGVSFMLMIHKRSIIARREWRSVLFTIGLPVVAIACCLLVLKVNIDPSSPTMLLTLENLQQGGPVPVAGVGFPSSLDQCAATTLRTPPDAACRGAIGLRFLPSVNGSYELSQSLLATIRRIGPLYGALAFDDPVIRNISSAFRMFPHQGVAAWPAPDSDEEMNRRRLGASALGTGGAVEVPGPAGTSSAAAAQAMPLTQLAQLLTMAQQGSQLPGAAQGGSGNPLEALLPGGTQGGPQALAGLLQAAAANPQAASALLPLLLGQSGGGILSPDRAQPAGASGGTPGGLPLGLVMKNVTDALDQLQSLAGLLGALQAPGHPGTPTTPGANVVEALGALEKLTSMTHGIQEGSDPLGSRQFPGTATPAPPTEGSSLVSQPLSGSASTTPPASLSGYSFPQGGPAGTGAPVSQKESEMGPRVIAAALRMANSLNVSSLALALPQLAQAGGGGPASAAVVSMAESLMRQNPDAAGQLIWNLMGSRKEGRVLQRSLSRLLAPPVTLLHNASSYHALPTLVSGLHEVVGVLNSGNQTRRRPTLVARSHPLPLTKSESVSLDNILLLLGAVFVLVPFCYLSGAFCINPVSERVTGAQHLQLLSGCPPTSYWAGSFAFDYLLWLAITAAAMLIFLAYGDKATVGTLAQAEGTLLLLLAYGASVIPLSYSFSHSFSSPSAAQVSIAALTFVFGFVTVIGSYVMKNLEKTRALQRVLVHFFRVMPPFLLGEGLIELTAYHFQRSMEEAAPPLPPPANATAPAPPIPQGAGLPHVGSVFKWHVLGRPIALMAIEAVAYFSLALLLDYDGRTGFLDGVRQAPLSWATAWQRRNALAKRGRSLSLRSSTSRRYSLSLPQERGEEEDNQEQHPMLSEAEAEEALTSEAADEEAPLEDADVAAERARVVSGAAEQDTICLEHLRKVYPGPPPKVAVHDLCLGVPAGQRFGLLGPNGAGKTTTLGMLTGRVKPSSGDALVQGTSVVRGPASARALLGFCPQQDPLIGSLTAFEQLALYASLKGVEAELVREEVEEVLARVAMPKEMAARRSGQYSGGNKRKLALGLALVGGVDAVLLDEPSSGMDPGARRAMWDFLVRATQESSPAQPGGRRPQSRPGMAVVLTTHSLDECEALCSRVGIMHQGRLKCLGSPTHLKEVYGGGYVLECDTPPDGSTLDALTRFVRQKLRGFPAEAGHGGRARFLIPRSGLPLASVLRQMEAARESLGVTAFGVSLPTLEQVFLRVVGEHLQG